ncbi:MAG TPA: hypothetical protein VMA86_00650 [Acetobacteraceae bacterium]|nr:hypothetical protein [Acetobacteraceae bacterium]
MKSTTLDLSPGLPRAMSNEDRSLLKKRTFIRFSFGVSGPVPGLENGKKSFASFSGEKDASFNLP